MPTAAQGRAGRGRGSGHADGVSTADRPQSLYASRAMSALAEPGLQPLAKFEAMRVWAPEAGVEDVELTMPFWIWFVRMSFGGPFMLAPWGLYPLCM